MEEQTAEGRVRVLARDGATAAGPAAVAEKNPAGTLLRIVAPTFVAGITVGERAAQIIGFMKDWSLDDILSYCATMGWKVEVLRETLSNLL
jgi:hypothetical protein